MTPPLSFFREYLLHHNQGKNAFFRRWHRTNCFCSLLASCKGFDWGLRPDQAQFPLTQSSDSSIRVPATRWRSNPAIPNGFSWIALLKKPYKVILGCILQCFLFKSCKVPPKKVISRLTSDWLKKWARNSNYIKLPFPLHHQKQKKTAPKWLNQVLLLIGWKDEREFQIMLSSTPCITKNRAKIKPKWWNQVLILIG